MANYKIIGGDGKEYGPVTSDQVRQWIVEGRANAQSQVQEEGSTDWKSLGSITEFAQALGLPVPTSVSTPPPYAPPLPGQAQQPVPEITTYLVPAILCTIFCCLPFGIVGIVYAAQVNTKKAAGDIQGALATAKNAKMWCWLSFGFGLAIDLCWVLFYLVMIGASVAGQH